MARLRWGERAVKAGQLMDLLRAHMFGLREGEIAACLGWDRRTVNNYLRAMQAVRLVYREGRTWHVENP
jgi:DNA-binding IclR family transcriptional regulator